MKKFIYILALMGLASASVQASVFNFAAYADGNSAGSTAITGLGESAYSSFSATDDGITVTATGTDANGAAYAYLDSGRAGLGVCSTPDTAMQCKPNSDDNVTGGEAVKLGFDRLVRLGSIRMIDANHVTTFGGDFGLSVDGGSLMTFTLAEYPVLAGLVGTTFEFFNIGGTVGSEFYINNVSVSAVPVPAAGILFASALLGAGAFGRRKKKAKASVVGAFARAS